MPDPYYTYSDSGLIQGNISVLQNSAQPLSSSANSSFYPATGWASLQVDDIVSRTWAHSEFTFEHIIWGNRIYRNTSNGTGAVGGYFNPRFSGFPSEVVSVDQGGDIRNSRFNYSTAAKANAATVIQVMHSLGYTESEYMADTYVVASGFTASDIAPLSTYNSSPATYFTDSSGGDSNPNEFWACTDRVWLPVDQIDNLPGTGHYIDIDWEMQDGRSEADTLAFAQHLASLCHAKNQKLSIWPNTLGNAGALYSGISANNVGDLIAAADKLSLMVFNDGTTTIPDQIDQIWSVVSAGSAPDASKLLFTFSLGNPSGNNTTPEDAIYLKRFAADKGITQFRFWRNFATQGSDDPAEDVNRKVGVIALGHDVPKHHALSVIF